jgi:hypothetical protein
LATSRERLEATLAELQSELAEMEELDSATRERLQGTLADITAALARRDASTSRSSESGTGPASLAAEGESSLDDEQPDQSLAERLNDATRGLESTHPQLSTTLGSVISALAQMGI